MKSSVIFSICRAFSSPLRLASSPLYCYPYRTSGEALRGDWQKIGKDIDRAIARMHEQ